MPRTLILRTAGTNCDRELAHAFTLAGSEVQIMHVRRLMESPERLASCDLLGLPGGFSYGDDISAGRIFANQLRLRLGEPIRRAVARGLGVIGICNGFQVLVKMGLLPDPGDGRQRATLSANRGGRFLARWVRLETESASRCLWTEGLGPMALPIAHGEGRFVPANDALLETLEREGQVALRYAADDDPNGSAGRVAGISDPSGRIFGLMPHPERCVDWTHHPAWTCGAGGGTGGGEPDGLRILRNAVQCVRV